MPFKRNQTLPKPPQNLIITGITKNSAMLKWSGDRGDIILFDVAVTEDVASPYTLSGLSSNTEYTVKVRNNGGESDEITFTTKEITYKEVTIVCDLKDKIAGSIEENPHIAKMQGSPNLLLPDSSSLYEFTQARYGGLTGLDDGQQYSVTNATAGNRLQVVFYFNVIEALERYDSSYFSDKGATTIAEKLEVVKKEVVSANYVLYGYGNGSEGHLLTTAACYTLTNVWENTTASQITNSQTLAEVKRTYTNAAFVARINSEGVFNLLAYAPVAGNTAPSGVNIDYVKLELTILVEED